MAITDTERPAIPAPLIDPLVRFMEANDVERIDIRRDDCEAVGEPPAQQRVIEDDAAPESLSRDAGVGTAARIGDRV